MVDASVVTPTNHDAILLPVDLDKPAVADLRARFERARAGSSITLDGSQLRHVHTPGVQLLCALVLAAEGRGATVVWRSVPPILVTYVRLLGIGDVIRFYGRLPEAVDHFE